MPITDKQLDKLRSATGTLSSTLAGGLLAGSGAGLLAAHSARTDESPEARKARIINSIITGGGLGAGAGLLLPLGAGLARGEEPGFFRRHSPLSAAASNPITTIGLGLSGAAGLRARGGIIGTLKDTYLHEQRENSKGKMVAKDLSADIPRDILHPSSGSPEDTVQTIADKLFGESTHSPETRKALARVAQGRGPLNVKDLAGLFSPENWGAATRDTLHATLPKGVVKNVARGGYTQKGEALRAVFKLLSNTNVSEKYPISLLGLAGGALLPAVVGAGIQKGVSG